MEPVGLGVIVASLLNGLRHGLDVDHIAAIGDIVSAQVDRRRSALLASLYSVGHAAIVFALGAVAIVAGARIPSGVDSFMSIVVGLSLVLLGIYVLNSFVRRRDARIRSRWQLIAGFVQRLRERRSRREVVIQHAHEHVHDDMHAHCHIPPESTSASSVLVRTKTHVHTHQHVSVMPADPLPTYGSLASFGVGVLHGIGAETPTQLLLFLTAAGVGTLSVGVGVLAAFVGGMLISNAAIAAAFSFGARGGRQSSWIYPTLTVTTAAFSVVVGVSYLLS